MGNEFTAADLSPHLVSGLTIIRNIVAANTVTNKVVPIAGGYHAKMRLRHAFTIRSDNNNNTTAGVLVVKHGGNTAVTITEGAIDDPAGHITEGAIVDQYKDVAGSDAIEAYFSTAPGADGLLLFLEYELVE